jgi:hypothetical protein
MLASDGHRLLRQAGVIPHSERFKRRAVYDYGHILHEIHLNAWVLAYRRASGGALVSWDGKRNIEPPPDSRNLSRRFEDDWSAEGPARRSGSADSPRRRPRGGAR